MGTGYDSRKARVVPFSYTDDNKTVRSGYLRVPEASYYDLNDNLRNQDNSEAIELFGITLDDGTELNYEDSRRFLNGHSPANLKLTVLNTPDARVDNPGFMSELKKSMSKKSTPIGMGRRNPTGDVFRENLRSFDEMEYRRK